MKKMVYVGLGIEVIGILLAAVCVAMHTQVPLLTPIFIYMGIVIVIVAVLFMRRTKEEMSESKKVKRLLLIMQWGLLAIVLGIIGITIAWNGFGFLEELVPILWACVFLVFINITNTVRHKKQSKEAEVDEEV